MRLPNGLLKIQHLTAQDLKEIEALGTLCRQTEALDLPLYLESAQPASDDETNQFLYYHNDGLVGVGTATPGAHIEVSGIVHPAYRRRGIGRMLLRAIKQECQHRGLPGLLLVCEEAAPSGQAFAQAVGAVYHSSEYRMELDRVAFARRQSPPTTLVLQQANRQDVGALVALWTASSDIGEEEAWQTTIWRLQQANQRFYIGRLANEPVGMLRLHQDKPYVFICSFRVLPQHRRQGYGRELLRGVIAQLMSEDWPHIMIEVATNNAPALGLYHSCGFQIVATYHYYHLSV